MKTIKEEIKDYFRAWYSLVWLIASVISLIGFIKEGQLMMTVVFVAIVPLAIIDSISSLRKVTKP